MVILQAKSPTQRGIFKLGSQSFTIDAMTFENISFRGGIVPVELNNVASTTFRNCGFTPNNNADADNAGLLVVNSFWTRFEGGAAEAAAAGKPSIIVRGELPAPNVKVSYLLAMRDFKFNLGGIEYQQNTDLTGEEITDFEFDNVATENFTTPFFHIKTAAGVTAAVSFNRLSFRNVTFHDAQVGTLPILKLERSGSGALTVKNVMLENVATPGSWAVQTMAANDQVTNVFVNGSRGAYRFVDALGNPSSRVWGVRVKDAGMDIFTSSTIGLSETAVNGAAGPSVRHYVDGEAHARFGFDASGIYAGPGAATGGWDSVVKRGAAGFFSVGTPSLDGDAGIEITAPGTKNSSLRFNKTIGAGAQFSFERTTSDVFQLEDWFSAPHIARLGFVNSSVTAAHSTYLTGKSDGSSFHRFGGSDGTIRFQAYDNADKTCWGSSIDACIDRSAVNTLNVSTKLAINGGTPITKHISATASLDFGSIAANSCSDLTMAVTGAADGDTVSLGVPNALASTAGLMFSGFVSAADTLTVRACNVATSASADPAAATVRADVWRH